MPKFNQNPFTQNARKTITAALIENPMKSIPVVPLMNTRLEMRPHIIAPQINHPHRKIPPPPPRRQIFRSDPEGMQQSPVVTEFTEKKNVHLAVVQQTNHPRIPPKPLINFGQQQRANLLHPNQFVFAKAQNIQNVDLINSLNSTTNLHHPPTKSPFTNFHTIHQQHPNSFSRQTSLHKPKQQQLVHKQMPPRMCGVINDYVENRAEKSDPENHIYEMIDEYEVSGSKIQLQVPTHHPPSTGVDETKENSNLFQHLLRAEMMNQIQSCSKIGNNGYLSHLPQQKRMDIIQETALSLASAAYLEK